MSAVVLIVDDTESCRRPVERLLHLEGYETRSAVNGQEALDVLKSFTPDLILLDLSMPLMGGFEVLGRLRDIPRLAALRVIVMTGETCPETDARARRLGACDVLSKSSVTPEALLRSIRHELVVSGADRKHLEA